MTTKQPKPKRPDGPWRHDFIQVCRIRGVPRLVHVPYTVYAHAEADAWDAMLDLVGHEGGTVAVILGNFSGEADE